MGIFSDFRKKVNNSFKKEEQNQQEDLNTGLIALGVLLQIIAHADEQFLSQEHDQIVEILTQNSDLSHEEMPVVLCAIEQAEKDRIDMFSFTEEASKDLDRESKSAIIENLFRVACSDQDLDNVELELIRKISGLFRLDHEEFIDAKVKVKKEFKMDTAGL